jgi:NADP-dependent aldehyde dehydrogenase
MPAHVVQHVPDEGFATGKALVQHPATAAVGFTGSYVGGMALQAYAQERKYPIPVFAEMGSVNPVLLLPHALQQNGKAIAEKYAASITQGMGQFCTNPGLLFGLASPELDQFAQYLVDAVQSFEASAMLHKGIEAAYLEKTKVALAQKGVELLIGQPLQDVPQVCIARVTAECFLANPQLHEEIFGPFSMIVACRDADDMLACRKALAGQLTTSLMGTDEDFAAYPQMPEAAVQYAGRVVFNGVPTGVEVTGAMVHGGPQPATTDSRFTAVGPMAIYRWTRPVCWQNAPQHLLPPALQDDNPLGIRRLVNGQWMQ